MIRRICLIFVMIVVYKNFAQAQTHAKDNGDIYVVPEDKFKVQQTTTEPAVNANLVFDYDAVMTLCNSSFSIPMDYIVEFNNTANLPDVSDKTGMCYIRCFYEQSGLLENWILNAEKIRQNIWPATGDTIQFCQTQGKSEINACVRAYAIAKCLMIRSIVDARNKPMI